MSLPLRERGLKFNTRHIVIIATNVAPLAGAWIEISGINCDYCPGLVAPLAGAWIEIVVGQIYEHSIQPSLPLRERGLKC